MIVIAVDAEVTADVADRASVLCLRCHGNVLWNGAVGATVGGGRRTHACDGGVAAYRGRGAGGVHRVTPPDRGHPRLHHWYTCNIRGHLKEVSQGHIQSCLTSGRCLLLDGVLQIQRFCNDFSTG